MKILWKSLNIYIDSMWKTVHIKAVFPLSLNIHSIYARSVIGLASNFFLILPEFIEFMLGVNISLEFSYKTVFSYNFILKT